LIYFFTGSLPWKESKTMEDESITNKIVEKKTFCSTHKLCEKCPEAMEEYMKYIKKIKYTESINYNYLIQLFQNCASKNKIPLAKLIPQWAREKSDSKRSLNISSNSGTLLNKSVNERKKPSRSQKRRNTSTPYKKKKHETMLSDITECIYHNRNQEDDIANMNFISPIPIE